MKPGVLVDRSVGVAVSGDYVYLGDGTHLAVVNASDPSMPKVEQRVGPLGDCRVWDVAADDDHVYVLCGGWRAFLGRPGVNVTVVVLETAADERSASVVGTLGLEEMAVQLTVLDGWVYVGGWWCEPGTDCTADTRGGVVVVDAREPSSLTYAKFVDVFGVISAGLLVDDDHLYVAGGGQNPISSLAGPVVGILDLSAPDAPELVAHISGDPLISTHAWYASSLARHEGLLYVGPGQTSVFDTRDPSKPEFLAQLSFPGGIGPIDMSASGNHIQTVTLPSHPQPSLFRVIEPVDLKALSGTSVEASVSGEVALPDYVDMGWPPDCLAADAGFVYVARGYYSGLYVVDVRRPAEPRVVGVVH